MAAPDLDDNDWAGYKRYVLNELDRHSKWLGDITNVQREILVAVAGLKVKSSVWGAVGGLLAALAALGIAIGAWLIRS